MKEFLTSVFSNFTSEMWDGNAPCGFGHKMIDGGTGERWSMKYGGGETYKGEILCANFSLNHKISIFICGNGLHIMDLRYSGKPDFWEYANREDIKFPGSPCCSERSRHTLEPEKIESILNTKIENCKFWNMVQTRAKELYELHQRREQE